MLCRWRQNKDPLPAPARNAVRRTSTAFNRTFRRHRDRRDVSVVYESATDGKPINNELYSQVCCLRDTVVTVTVTKFHSSSSTELLSEESCSVIGLSEKVSFSFDRNCRQLMCGERARGSGPSMGWVGPRDLDPCTVVTFLKCLSCVYYKD